jgi:hypothetical protein
MSSFSSRDVRRPQPQSKVAAVMIGRSWRDTSCSDDANGVYLTTFVACCRDEEDDALETEETSLRLELRTRRLPANMVRGGTIRIVVLCLLRVGGEV